MVLSVLLDTDTCSYALAGNPSVLERLTSLPPASVCVSAVTVAELLTHVEESGARSKAHGLANFLAPLQLLSFDSEDAGVYAAVRARLENAGTPIGPLDTLIAAQALARNLTLVSNNERELRRVRGLRLENWIA